MNFCSCDYDDGEGHTAAEKTYMYTFDQDYC